MTARRAAASLLAVVAVAALAAPGPARAEWKPSGSLTAAMLVRPSVGYSRCGDTGKPCDGTVYGGGVWVDLQQPIGPLRLGGVIGCLLPETLFARPTTAHILGGCPMGRRAEEGVIDLEHRLHGHSEILVVDGSAVSANPGVNPSLTITALAERAMARIPDRA